MKHLLLALFIFLLFSTEAQEKYFQQEVNYEIDVKLDDKRHILHAHEKIEYINNSPDQLEFIYFHLWPNAYKDRSTAFAQQKIRTGSSRFHFADNSQRGYIDSLDFKVNNKKAEIEEDPENPDIIKVILNTPLLPGEKLLVTTPFRVKLPDSFSRLGHVNQQYQITQWYPKPAVYDKNGWHQMPYLDMGEFYSEFGSFKVNITVPQNYVVGATGNLQNPEEEMFLDSLAEVNSQISEYPSASEDKFPPTASTYKTLTYVQDNVHDFAWFADKRYTVKRGEVILPESGRKVKLLALYNLSNGKAWEDIIEYMHDGVYYYSKWIGDYPYDVVTVIDGALSAGSGMEYPTITVLGAENPFMLEVVTVHEIGHNWFYGILASNERTHPWMDEGLNSYYEMRYFKTKYPDVGIFGLDPEGESFGEKLARFGDVSTTSHHKTFNIGYTYIASFNIDQPNDTHSNKFIPINYGIMSYQKTAAQMDYLYEYLGEDLFDECMKTYYTRWKFKHPQPDDLQAVFEEISGKDLGWMFDDFLKTRKKLDYQVGPVKKTTNGYNVTLKNNGKIQGPVSVSALNNSNEPITETWLAPFQGKKEIKLSGENFEKVALFHDQNIPDLWPYNNVKRTSGLLPGVRPLRFKLLFGLEDPEYTNMYWLPTLGANTTDKFMLGAAFYNTIVPNKRFRFIVNPMYSFGLNQHAGYYDLNYQLLPENTFRSIEFGVEVRDFAEMQKVAPRVVFDFRSDDPAFTPDQTLTLKHHFMYSGIDLYEEEYQIGRIDYTIQKSNALRSYRFSTSMTTDYDSFTTLELTGNFVQSYKSGRSIRFRGYLGGFLQKNDILPVYRLNFSGSPDFTMDGIFTDRAGISDHMEILNQQTDLRQGGMRGFINEDSQEWIATLNADIDMPFSKLFQWFVDTGYDFEDSEFYYTTGLSLNVGGIVYFYLPVAGDSFVDTAPESWDEFRDNVRFSIKLNNLNPWKLAENNLF